MNFTEIQKPPSITKLPFYFDVENIVKLINNLNEKDWTDFNFRQKTFSIHKQTKSIPVLWVPLSIQSEDVIFLSEIQEKNPFFYNKVTSICKEVLNYLEHAFNGKIFKILLVRLESQGSIPPHNDNLFSLEQTHRIHIPIITNDLVFFTVDNCTINMKSGCLYEINNRLIHSVVNKSSVDRVHLIVDVIENKTIEEITKANKQHSLKEYT